MVIEVRIAVIIEVGVVLLTGRAGGNFLVDGYALYFDLGVRHIDVYTCKMSLSYSLKSCVFYCI